MGNRVITIARSYGSGGRKMGRLLAKELGYEYYDREILRIASDESGISEELFNQVDETKKMPLFRIARELYECAEMSAQLDARMEQVQRCVEHETEAAQ